MQILPFFLLLFEEEHKWNFKSERKIFTLDAMLNSLLTIRGWPNR